MPSVAHVSPGFDLLNLSGRKIISLWLPDKNSPAAELECESLDLISEGLNLAMGHLPGKGELTSRVPS